MTIPAEIRESLGIKKGDVRVVEPIDRQIIIRRADELTDWTVGALKACAKPGLPDPRKEREWFGGAIAREVADSLEDE